MPTRDLFPNEIQKRYVTFALPASSVEMSPGGSWDRDRRRVWLAEHGACLVLSIVDESLERTASHVSTASFIRGLFGPNFWITAFRDKVVVGDRLVSTEGTLQPMHPPIRFGRVQRGRLFSWSRLELENFCLNLAQFSNCFSCEYAGDFAACIQFKASNALEDLGVERPNAEHKWNGFYDNLLYCDEDLEKYLGTESKKDGWTFIKPGNFSGAFSNRLIRAIDVDIETAEDSLVDARRNREAGVQTIAAAKRCKEECYIYANCSGCTKPYYGTPHRCQTGTEYMQHDHKGPFTEDEFNLAYRLFREEINARPEHEIRFIAYNAGVSTWILGYELELCKMESNLRDVQFVRPTTMDRFTFSYEDALLLLSTPYRDGKVYSKPDVSRVEKKMSEKALNTYTEVCQYNYGKDYVTWWRSVYATPYIRNAGWYPGIDSISLILKPGHSFDLDSVGHAFSVLGYHWRPLPPVVYSRLTVVREQLGAAAQETS